MKSNLIDIEPISLTEVKDILQERKAEKELNYEQEVTLKYAESFARLTKKQLESLIKSLEEYSFLKENKELLYQIIMVLPTSVEQLKLIIPKEVEVSEDDLKGIVEKTKKHGEKN